MHSMSLLLSLSVSAWSKMMMKFKQKIHSPSFYETDIELKLMVGAFTTDTV